MTALARSDGFFKALPRLTKFAALGEPAGYAALPDDWTLGTADIVGSTRAVADGRYKTVNMIGAAVISAQINSGAGPEFPFVFGGDGAGFACPPSRRAASAAALSAVRLWAQEEFGLALRVAHVPMTDIRKAGRDVRVARYQPAPGVDYAMFRGGGLTWAEGQMKAGRFGLPEAPAGTFPDLDGLSCRWSNVRARNGSILSLVIQPGTASPGPGFSRVVQEVIEIAAALNRGGHPVPEAGSVTRWPPPGLTLEAHASRGALPLARRKRQLLVQTLVNWFFLRTRIPVAGFDPTHYTVTVGRNADFRKFDDGLKMTLDCDAATRDRLRAVLDPARQSGILRYGMVEQDEAMMTCIVPSHLRDDHMHFIDGAAGGYTQAAAQMK